MPQRIAQTFQTRRALLCSLVPRDPQASPAQKTLLLDVFVEWTGYTRKQAIKLLNHGAHEQQSILVMSRFRATREAGSSRDALVQTAPGFAITGEKLSMPGKQTQIEHLSYEACFLKRKTL